MHKIVENYILYESIGSGQYGKVFRAKNTKTNETVAVKSVPLEKFREVQKLEEFTANEIKTLNRIKCPNVIRFIEMLKTANNMYLVYEFCDGGTIEDILQKKHHLSEVESLKYFAQLVNAFKHIYRENILHRDLKPSNILLHNGIAKIADFGFCKKMNGPQELTFTMVGSPIYMAPEVLKGYPYNIKADIWSLGVVLYEMIYGICPYEEKTLPALISLIDTRPLIFYPEVNKISANTEELLRRMLTHDHRARIEWTELLEFPLNIEQLEKQSSNASGPTINMAVVNYHDEQNTFKQQVEERITKIIKTLMKERNRVAFVSNVLHTMLELNISNKTPVVGFMTLKRMLQLLETLKKEISVENSSSRFKSLERWNEYQNTDDFLAFSRYVNEEMEEASAFLNIYKQELNVLVNSNPNDADLRDPSFKAERSNTALDMKYYHSALIQYVEDVKNAAQEKIKANDELEANKLLIHAIEVLDCDNIEEFFEKSLGAPGLKLSDQPYFADVKNQSKEKQLDAINMKLNQARNRVL